MTEESTHKAEVSNGELECNARVAHFEANLYHSLSQIAVALHPLTQKPVVNAITVGGMSKRLGIAKDLLPYYLRQGMNGVLAPGHLDNAVSLAFEAADALIAEDKKSRE